MIVVRNIIPQEIYQRLVLEHILFPGVYYEEEGNIAFNSITTNEYKNRVQLGIDDRIAYYTRSMGRGIFTIGNDGEIINFKGVDTNLNLGEVKTCNISSVLGRNQPRHEIVVTYFNHGSYSGHKKKPQIRVKGASQLQDLIREYEKLNTYKECQLIKFPTIRQVIPLSKEFCQKYNLPNQVSITDDFIKKMQNEDCNEIRKGIVGKSRMHCIEILNTLCGLENTRCQTWHEYFFSLSDQEKLLIQNIPDINEAIYEEDRRYGLGAMFGQATRILENPFRISDLAFYVNNKDSLAIKNVLCYSQMFYDQDYLLSYATTMGKNMAGFMNQKIANHLWSHRQDFALSAEICDEAYNDVSINLTKDDCFEQYLQQKTNLPSYKLHSFERTEQFRKSQEEISIIVEDQVKYYAQFFLFGSNMKVIEDAYRLLGYSIPDNYQNAFIRSFIDNLENTEIIINEIQKWALRLFGKTGELETVLGKRAKNSIIGFEEYIEDLFQRLLKW